MTENTPPRISPNDVLRQFVEDVKLSVGTGCGDAIDEELLAWPEMAATYKKALEALMAQQPRTTGSHTLYEVESKGRYHEHWLAPSHLDAAKWAFQEEELTGGRMFVSRMQAPEDDTHGGLVYVVNDTKCFELCNGQIKRIRADMPQVPETPPIRTIKSTFVQAVNLSSGEEVEIRRLEGGPLVGFDGAYLSQLEFDENPLSPYEADVHVIIPDDEPKIGADPYTHLTVEQKDIIRQKATEALVGDIMGDKDNPRFWAEYIIKDWGIDQCLEQLSDDQEEQANQIGFDPETGKPTKEQP